MNSLISFIIECITFCIWFQKSSTPPSAEWSERCFWVGALAISFLYSSGFTSSHIHLLLTGTVSWLHHNSSSKLFPILDGKLQTSQAASKMLLLSKRRHQLNWEQALQSHCPVSSESIQCALSGHPMYGETAIIICFFLICLCIIVI